MDAAKTVCRVVDKGEDIIDAAKEMRRFADVADDIKDSTGKWWRVGKDRITLKE